MLQDSGGLLYGITNQLLRVLCESPFNGGGGYSPRELATWTPDQIYFRAASVDAISKRARQQVKSSWECLKYADKQGRLKGRAADGSVLTLPISKGGKSLASHLREQQASEQSQKANRRRRRGTRTR